MELLIFELVLGMMLFAVSYAAALVLMARAKRKLSEKAPEAEASAGARSQFGQRTSFRSRGP
jgi:hypothetical protein